MTVYRRIRIRRGTALQWSESNSTLHQGELGLDLTAKKIKVGDGFTSWNDLDFLEQEGLDALRAEYGDEQSFNINFDLHNN